MTGIGVLDIVFRAVHKAQLEGVVDVEITTVDSSFGEVLITTEHEGKRQKWSIHSRYIEEIS